MLLLAVNACNPAVAQDNQNITQELFDEHVEDVAQGNVPEFSEAEREAIDATPAYFDQSPAEDDPTPAEDENEFWGEVWKWLLANWGEALLGLVAIIEIIVGLTPTERDNAWFKWLRDIIYSIVPNKKKGGGTHEKA